MDNDEFQDSPAPTELPEEVQRYLDGVIKMSNGIVENCLVCDEPISKLEQVGRSVYAVPCGHRQYQGWLPRNYKAE
jgi:hypothetical protein